MSAGSLIAADLVVAVLVSAGWLGAGGAAAAGRGRVALGLGLFALLATVVRAVTVVALARAGWWFAAEKVLIAGPFAVAGVAVAAPSLVRRRAAAVPLLFAGYTSIAGLLVSLLHGYPVSVGAGLLAAAGVLAATVATWRFVGPRPSRRVFRAAVLASVAALVAGTGFAVSPGSPSGAGHAHIAPSGAGHAHIAPSGAGHAHTAPSGAGHAHTAPPASVGRGTATVVGKPARRFTLTAATATVNVNGRNVQAWTFNGQVPGPEISATVGDVIEVTLRNKDIDRGVTLHWHGYDVPNDQDGVPGVTQEAVLPGHEFVYRFRADQPGTYWYHTHSASDIGVRKGLYGVLLVHPATSEVDSDVVVPVHTLDGVVLPAPEEAAVPAGTPVRLRLINTDSTTHRYAPGGSYRVAAIDGRELRDPPTVSGTALLIPAGGRYDVVMTAPAALTVDGRLLWSAGGATAAPDGWPVLDPLTYGQSAPGPFARFDRTFTLVLDRGLDLRGLLPRYAHTVNGAADPDIPVQSVRLGDVVRFRIVNRSLVVHPWHLHGYHVLVLSRNGRPATGSPLWLDSFDVRPGEVWEVAFQADNPGMWANHCHNLPHADAGMMLHLMVSG
ncbi:multicopper oxidase family protein [Actinoplanes bogorensis]|uniref:Multicopper oxidase family protein n=1 Tax=Paractinoplanes bogorensis TaxID=1610840 RepID=A0ABS5YPQ7_9ACTN|nr:multicopper oxidase family protein [Actinoplanes bogorensis]MBU2664683.1 multicopper oxidase family protein [Actinoplanes bogorensis]